MKRGDSESDVDDAEEETVGPLQMAEFWRPVWLVVTEKKVIMMKKEGGKEDMEVDDDEEEDEEDGEEEESDIQDG